MFAVIRSVLSCSCLLTLLAVVASIPLLSAPLFAQSLPAPGGFLELATSTDVRPTLTPSQVQALLPTRGLFTFPAPYLTQGIRLTNPADCGGADCVNYVGYSYWRNINNHVGSDTMLIFLGLNRTLGGGGPTLFSYNKVTDAVTNLGPLFDPTSPYSWATGEGWYFSATLPTTLYLNDGPKLLRYNVLTKQLTTVLDVSAQPALFGTNKIIWQMHSSSDDLVHSATLKDGTTYAKLGCFAYREDTKQFFYFPQLGYNYDECQIDKSGRWLLIKEKLGTDPVSEVDNRIIDLQASPPAERDLLDRNGAAGHSDNGYGYMVAADDWNPLPNAWRPWKFGQNPLQGSLVYYGTEWTTMTPNHVSHLNAKSGVAPEQQYACGSSANRVNTPFANEIICFRLDGSLNVLVVAPVMTDLNATGGGSDDYSKLPKGNLDVTGQYFIWTSNMASNRLDAFIVKVPAQLLTSAPLDTIPPTVSITAPTSGSTVAGTATVSASASDNVGVVGVQFKLDGANLGAEDTVAPYSVSWNTTTAVNGAHTLTAVARDATGNTTTSSSVRVTVANGGTSGGSATGACSVQNIIWTNLVNVTATGNSLQKTSGCDGCDDAGAISQQQITSGNGYVEFTASETTTLRYAGLSNGNSGTRGAEIEFAIRLQSGIAEVRENDVYRANTTFVTGDVFRIGVESGVVKYYKNGTLFYASTVAPLYPLLVDTSILSLKGTITNAVMCKVTTVEIDITPGSTPNSINPKSKGVIPVAILTADTFAATTVDSTKVRFGATGAEAAPVQVALEDVDGDGDTDMILHFNTQDTGIKCGDTSASLTGETVSGQAIQGSDSINTVGC